MGVKDRLGSSCSQLTGKGVRTQGLNLSQGDFVPVGVGVDAQDEGVLVGVMLDDVVVHVHQDPVTQK